MMNDSFLKRFQSVRAHKQRTLMGETLARTALCVLLGLILAVAADYWWELDRSLRQACLAVAGLLAVAYGLRAVMQLSRVWSTPKTASEIEDSFPELGQSVRTSVQFGRMTTAQVQAEGVAATLVTALVEETHRRALPLTIEDVIPTQKLWLSVGALLVGAVGWAALTGMDWEWRTATARTLFSERSYRELTVDPKNVTVDEGGRVEVTATLTGRTNRTITLFTRVADRPDAEWTERFLTNEQPSASAQASASSSTPRPSEQFAVEFDRLTKPVEYFVRAGDLQSPTYRIRIRRPLRIDSIAVDLSPPDYTGQETSTVRDGNVVALEGTQARFHITFDKAIKSATMIIAARKPASDDEAVPEPRIIPLEALPDESASASSDAELLGDDRPVTAIADLDLVEDGTYTIQAEAADGTVLGANKYRIRIRQDQPPQVFFESPDDQVEVHSLAELPMRVRVRDDYGLSRAGILFQINNEQEIPLVNENFEVVAAAADEVAANGRVSPTTQAALEKLLPLEVFELTQKDSVMYYAFAEDNRPDRPQRTESELRFIDIRPFKRQYRIVDPDPMPAGMNMGGGNLKSLEELIQRQRFAVNRTIQIEKRAKVGRKPDASELDQLMKFETDLATSVRETALGLEARGFDDTELFYQAEMAMLQAVDSLSVGNWENASQQMKDALKLLIEQRDRTIRAIFKNPDPARLAALRQFDREQSQKLRRPKSDKEEARELIRRLEELIRQEGAVAEGFVEGDSPAPKITPEAAPVAP
ncbi:MAG TPA: DUF4175 family protein [Planctomycetaceae bacterium]|nr:DUF4175 family protein [Planctomycetaceae bacterium]